MPIASPTISCSGSLDETEALNRSQVVTGSQKHRDPRFPPFAFTEHGAIMAATVLSSPRAVEMSLYIVRAFVRLRELLASNTALARKLARFPIDFMFQLSVAESAALRSRIATSKPTSSARGGRRYLPYAFTEHGAIQAANLLNSRGPSRWAFTSCAPSCSFASS
jgi:hypothetical protein